MHVVVVESPAKAKTINNYLGADYHVLASFGHVRDLPSKDGSVLPDSDFALRWHTDTDAAKRLKSIAAALKNADSLILATDPDREGEAISWHVLEALTEKKALKGKNIQRVAFNAITRSAVAAAMKAPRALDDNLVHAYLARRALDYLVGFTLSPVLWRKLPGSRSAGRVQSVALRLVVNREMEIQAFRPREYWSISADLVAPSGEHFAARLHALDGKKLEKFSLADQDSANKALARVKAADLTVTSVESKTVQATPPPPFTTSTLQQEAARKLGFDARHTMSVAQKLYEAGHITYMRTDGVQMAEEAYAAVRDAIEKRFDQRYVPPKIRRFSAKAKNAQEAHEAIRPNAFSTSGLGQDDHGRLYDLIWTRAVASQMSAARLDRVAADIACGPLVLRATGQTVAFDGYLRLYREGKDDSRDDSDTKTLPPLTKGAPIPVSDAAAKKHITEPPARYSESSLVRRMEELGIGRPSTYAATLSTLRDRGYARMERKRFIPEESGRLVTMFLERYFEHYIAYDFTADLEEKLDQVSDGKIAWKTLLHEFWQDFKSHADSVSNIERTDIIDALDEKLGPSLFPDNDDGSNPRACPQCSGGRLGLKLSRHGAFIGCSAYPDCSYTRSFVDGDKAHDRANDDRIVGVDPANGRNIMVRNGPYGPYVESRDDKDKAKRVTIPKGWNPDELDLDKAARLIGLPRTVGEHPEDGEPVVTGIGRYGPFVRHVKTYATLPSVEEVFDVGLNRAVSLIADKRANPGKRTAPTALKDLGSSPDGGEPIHVYQGRYGPYVKQGKINATLPKNISPDDITLEQACALVADKKSKGKTGRKKASTRG